MDKSKRMKLTQISPVLDTQNLEAIGKKTGNLYEALYIISCRANQISRELKEELHAKLEDFASHSDSYEEVQENREQIEISRFYERLPHPTIIATKEFMNDELTYRYEEERTE
ncbi:MAG: DNA-directed RNA polymerase subunit omega [Chitinophagales bacterium]|nr:DNA-directed RNA polymerase subunit omega [Chitinophagales bacterium]MDW8419991.1 DNA-directed RNA polymerase subunit omega [Chitinophagales bacterium]